MCSVYLFIETADSYTNFHLNYKYAYHFYLCILIVYINYTCLKK